MKLSFEIMYAPFRLDDWVKGWQASFCAADLHFHLHYCRRRNEAYEVAERLDGAVRERLTALEAARQVVQDSIASNSEGANMPTCSNSPMLKSQRSIFCDGIVCEVSQLLLYL